LSTPSDIIVAAIGRSSKNRADILANNSEMLALVYRSLRGVFSIGAEVNPLFFAKTADVAVGGSGWSRPADAEAVFRIELLPAPGAEVVVVPFDDQGAEAGLPAVYRYGQIYRSAGNTYDPVAQSLRFFYSKIPASPATVGDSFDALWPTTFDALLIEDVATYLAVKDGRMDEAQALIIERNMWLARFVAFLEHETVNERRRFGQVKRFNTASLTALVTKLASGGAA
jgi:hypothetical protein